MNEKYALDRPDPNNCLVNLANSVLKRFGAATTAASLPLADEQLVGEYRNVVLMVLDALGVSIIEKHLDPNGFFRSHLAGSFDSVYPPTTVAATTSILSGLYPNEHGWLGWDIFFPAVGKNVTVYRNTEQETEKDGAKPVSVNPDGSMVWGPDSLNEEKEAADYNAGARLIPYKSIIERINEAGGQAHLVSPFAPPFPQDADAVFERIGELCEKPGEKYIYAYWMEPDSTMHATGTNSPDTHRMVRELEAKLEKAVSGLDDTLFIITADHGHIDSRNLCILDYPEVLNCLVRMPSLEPRTLNMFVKDEYKAAFPEIFKRNFGDAFRLFTREEALRGRLFGIGRDREGLEGMIGDYVAAAVSDVSIFTAHYPAQQMPGAHAGATAEEYVIPLIVIKKERTRANGAENNRKRRKI